MKKTEAIDLRFERRKGLLDEDRFYDLLSKQCNYMSEENVKTVYLGLVKLITTELRAHALIRLPHLGDFAIVEIRTRYGPKGGNSRGPLWGELKDVNTIRFYANYLWRDYFKALKNLK